VLEKRKELNFPNIFSPLLKLVPSLNKRAMKDYFIKERKSMTFFTLEFHARISRCGKVKGRVSDFLGHEGAEFFFTSAEAGGGLHESRTLPRPPMKFEK
jgi:hypothetical protein